MHNILIQIIGAFAVMIVLWSYHPKHKKNILWLQLIASLLWVIHFGLLGAITGAAINAAGAVRMYIFNTNYAHSKRRSVWLLVGVCSMMIIVSAVSWQGTISLLPLIGVIVSTLAFWQHDPQRIRIILLFTAPFWLTYNTLSGSIAGVACELLAFASICLALSMHAKITKRSVRPVAVKK